jgi:flagellar biosynthesis/type III secretory pathway protein FliH
MPHEIQIAFPRPLVGVLLGDAEVPEPVVDLVVVSLPPPPEPVPAEPQPSARELELERHFQAEHAAVLQTLDGLKAAVRDLQAQQRQRVGELRTMTVELAVKIAERLVHEKIQAGDYNLEGLVRDLVKQLDADQPVTIRLHPDDLALLERRLAGQPLLTEGPETRYVADPTVEHGNALAEAGSLSVQSNREKQLADIHEHLLRSVGHARTES